MSRRSPLAVLLTILGMIVAAMPTLATEPPKTDAVISDVKSAQQAIDAWTFYAHLHHARLDPKRLQERVELGELKYRRKYVKEQLAALQDRPDHNQSTVVKAVQAAQAHLAKLTGEIAGLERSLLTSALEEARANVASSMGIPAYFQKLISVPTKGDGTVAKE